MMLSSEPFTFRGCRPVVLDEAESLELVQEEIRRVTASCRSSRRASPARSAARRGWVCPSCRKRASNNSVRARRFSLELKSWSTRSCSNADVPGQHVGDEPVGHRVTACEGGAPSGPWRCAGSWSACAADGASPCGPAGRPDSLRRRNRPASSIAITGFPAGLREHRQPDSASLNCTSHRRTRPLARKWSRLERTARWSWRRRPTREMRCASNGRARFGDRPGFLRSTHSA